MTRMSIARPGEYDSITASSFNARGCFMSLDTKTCCSFHLELRRRRRTSHQLDTFRSDTVEKGKAYAHSQRRGDDQIEDDEVSNRKHTRETRSASTRDADRNQRPEERQRGRGDPGGSHAASRDESDGDARQREEEHVKNDACDRDGWDELECVAPLHTKDMSGDGVERTSGRGSTPANRDQRA